jgi:hypothetical protein
MMDAPCAELFSIAVSTAAPEVGSCGGHDRACRGKRHTRALSRGAESGPARRGSLAGRAWLGDIKPIFAMRRHGTSAGDTALELRSVAWAPPPGHSPAAPATPEARPCFRPQKDARHGMDAVGRDGVPVEIPEWHSPLQGRDGRMVAVPLGHLPVEGPDGRIVPVPPGQMGLPDGRGRIRLL